MADPFMGSGSTIAAAEAVGVRAIGVERHLEYYEMSRYAIPKLAVLKTTSDGSSTSQEQLEQLELF